MILFRYILRHHFLPFVFSIFTLMSVFLLQFLMKFADRLVGKGLSVIVIAKLISYNLAWMVVLVVPMAVLIATLMAFGTMAQNNEITILKASGISLYKMIFAPFLASFVVAYLLMQFNNHVYPNANHAARILGQDISRKKPTLSIIPGVFSQEVKNYSILVREIDPITNELGEVTIYDQSNHRTTNLITAKKGKIYFSKDQKKLLMDLVDGEIHESDITKPQQYRKLEFEKHKIAMDADQFSFQQSSTGGQRGERELGAEAMLVIVDSLNVLQQIYLSKMNQNFSNAFINDSVYISPAKVNISNKENLVYMRTSDRIRAHRTSIISSIRNIENNLKTINKYWVEIHKKYALPVACIVFILIGAPLGTMTRKGGFGVAAGISLVFFLIYWAFLIGGEKLADRGLLSPFWGMWSANIVLGILGVLLTVKSAKERVIINFDFFKRFLPKQWRETSEDSR